MSEETENNIWHCIACLLGILIGIFIGFQIWANSGRGKALTLEELSSNTVYEVNSQYRGDTWLITPDREILYTYLRNYNNLKEGDKFMKIGGAIVEVKTPN